MICRKVCTPSRTAFYLINAPVTSKMMFFTTVLIFAFCTLGPISPVALKPGQRNKKSQKMKHRIVAGKHARQRKKACSIRAVSMLHSRVQNTLLLMAGMDSPQSLCDKAFSKSGCDNAGVLVVIRNRKGDPKVSAGKLMYQSTASIFMYWGWFSTPRPE